MKSGRSRNQPVLLTPLIRTAQLFLPSSTSTEGPGLIRTFGGHGPLSCMTHHAQWGPTYIFRDQVQFQKWKNNPPAPPKPCRGASSAYELPLQLASVVDIIICKDAAKRPLRPHPLSCPPSAFSCTCNLRIALSLSLSV